LGGDQQKSGADKANADNKAYRIVSVCITRSEEDKKKFDEKRGKLLSDYPALQSLAFRIRHEDDFEEMKKDFEMPGLPFAVLVENSGLVAWRGHPDDRDLKDDINELMLNHMLFETEDWYDDPDKPKPDPDEVEMQKDLDTQNKKPKKLVRIMQEIEKKIKYFYDKFIDDKLNVKAEDA
jgi:hypothetical protein